LLRKGELGREGGRTGDWRSCTVCAGSGHLADVQEKGNIYGFWWGKAEGKSPLGRPGRRWEDTANVDVKVVGFGDVHWVDLSQDRSNR